MSIKLYNSISRRIEKFEPYDSNNVRVYSCGPTVYDYLSIGNFRTFVTSDILRRILEYNNFRVKTVMNITDVGHLTGDGDLGEDRLVKASKRERKTAWDIAKHYTRAFIKDINKLNITPADVMPKATDHINEQIKLIKILEKKGLTYKISDGVYFDTKVYEKKTGRIYGKLSTLDKLKAGARVEKNPEKKNQRDFALWKLSEKPGDRHMEWDSPWGLGFPGWHIECSAMSMKYLGQSFDIHTGGEDLRQTHHPNEIAQSEAATGKPFVKYWIHVTFLLVDGRRMGRSLGNIYTVSDVEKKGYDPLSLRYLYLTAHYRDPLNFTWRSLTSAQEALEKIRDRIAQYRNEKRKEKPNDTKQNKISFFRDSFHDAINNDLNTPRALAILWDLLKSDISAYEKFRLTLSFDKVFGLGLAKTATTKVKIPDKIKRLLREREKLRKEEQFKKSDVIRKRIEQMGYIIEDTQKGSKVKREFYKKTSVVDT